MPNEPDHPEARDVAKYAKLVSTKEGRDSIRYRHYDRAIRKGAGYGRPLTRTERELCALLDLCDELESRLVSRSRPSLSPEPDTYG